MPIRVVLTRVVGIAGAWLVVANLTSAAAQTPGPAKSALPPLPTKAAGSASAVHVSHPQAAAMIKAGLAQVEAGSRELDAIRDEQRKAAAALRVANMLLLKGKHQIAEGQRLQKLGRELKRRGNVAGGDLKISAGARAIDEGARDVNLGIAGIRAAQAQLNSLHGRAAKAHELVDDGRKKVKTAEGLL